MDVFDWMNFNTDLCLSFLPSQPEFMCIIDSRLGGVKRLYKVGLRTVAETESGVPMIVPLRAGRGTLRSGNGGPS